MVLYVVGVALAASVAIATSSNGSFADTLRLATSHQPETFTELYFVNPSQLPSYAAAGSTQTVHFRIQSHLTTQQTYTYRITIVRPQGTSVSTASVVLVPGRGVTVPVTFSILQPNETATIMVNLLGTDQQLTLKVKS